METKTTITVGIALMLTAVASAVLTETQSITAWIPLLFGLPIAAMGAVAALKVRHRKNAMHVAAALALLGTLGGVRVLPGLGAVASGTFAGSWVALGAQLVLLVLCAALLAVCVRSFVAARRARKG